MSDSLVQIIRETRFRNPDSSILLLNGYYADFMEKGDTLSAVTSLTILSTVYGTQAIYHKAYDNLWKALLLANEANLEIKKALIYRRIGRHYSFYKRKEEALALLNLSLSLKKSLSERGLIDKSALSFNYIAFSATYREVGSLQLAQTYLDSAFMYAETGEEAIKLPYLKVEQAFIFSEVGKYKEAIQILEDVIPWFENTLPSYLVLIYSYLGDAYRGENRLNKSEKCYQDALTTSSTYHSHVDFSSLVHEKLSDLYEQQGNYTKAHEQLKQAYQLDKSFFDSRSENNRSLLEVRDKFREEMESKEQFLKEQRLEQLEYKNRVSFFQKTTISVLLIALVLFSVLYFYYLKSKHQSERQLSKRERELELQKNKELLEIKNKELATSTLKLIEKDEFLQELKNKVNNKKDNLSLQEVKHLIKISTININSAGNWAEFEARFVAVNKKFYENLKEKYPNLSPGDLKLSALVKLNFTSKEMARLMGISVESVHTTRYRLRKKLGVPKGADLTDFISRL